MLRRCILAFRAVLPAAAAGALLLLPARAGAIPAFARQYRLDCRSCHTVCPQLNPMGERFREMGFRIPRNHGGKADSREAEYRRALSPDLRLAERLFDRSPFSIKLTGDLRHESLGTPETRPFWEELLMNAGYGRGRWSFYLHQHLHKGGHPGKEEYAAWVQANDLLQSKHHRAALQAGLFELELGLSPHVSRVSYLPYLPYGIGIGSEENFTLGEPELGVQLRGSLDPGWRYALAIVTGSGLHNENNGTADVYARLENRSLGPEVGVFAYTGRRELKRRGLEYQNDVLRAGIDARWHVPRARDLHLFGILVWGSDDRVFTSGRFRRASSLAGSLGADYMLNRRLLFHGRVEWLRTSLPGSAQDLARPVAGLHWSIKQNVRLSLEGTWESRRKAPDETKVFLGALWAF